MTLDGLVTETWVERVHAQVQGLADDYPAAHTIWATGLVMPPTWTAGPRHTHRPESRTPTGRDPAITTGLLRAAHHLARAHSWASWWQWPSPPWMPESMYSHGSDTCTTCPGNGQSVTVVDHDGTAVLLLGWCVPCAGTGVSRNLHPPDFPPPAWEVQSAAWQMAGYLSALRPRTPRPYEEHVWVELLRAASAAATAVRWVSLPLPDPEVPCSNCAREPATEGSLGATCARYLRRTGTARPPHLWIAP